QQAVASDKASQHESAPRARTSSGRDCALQRASATTTVAERTAPIHMMVTSCFSQGIGGAALASRTNDQQRPTRKSVPTTSSDIMIAVKTSPALAIMSLATTTRFRTSIDATEMNKTVAMSAKGTTQAFEYENTTRLRSDA